MRKIILFFCTMLLVSCNSPHVDSFSNEYCTYCGQLRGVNETGKGTITITGTREEPLLAKYARCHRHNFVAVSGHVNMPDGQVLHWDGYGSKAAENLSYLIAEIRRGQERPAVIEQFMKLNHRSDRQMLRFRAQYNLEPKRDSNTPSEAIR